MTTTKPTILLIHGGWHNRGCWDKLILKLEAEGYPTIAPTSPSSGGLLPAKGLIEDGQAVVEELERLVEEQEKDVLVIGHSYGGMVMTQGVLGKFAKSKRMEKGKKGGVIRIVYLCAFILRKDESNWSHYRPTPKDRSLEKVLPPIDDEGFIGIPTNYADMFYNNMPKEEQDKYGAMLTRLSALCGSTFLTEESHQHHPVSYWYAPEDEAVALVDQKKMTERIESETGIKIEKEIIEGAGHSPFITHPDEMVKLVTKTVNM